MVYLVFDLDETLGSLYSPYYYLCDLTYERFFKNTDPDYVAPPPASLAPKLKIAYKEFVQNVADIENSVVPLGILRPGIIDVFRKITELKDAGVVDGVLIYSNNGNLPSLEFVRDVIEEAVGKKGLFCDLIHWYHPGREVEWTRDIQGRTRPGSARKTWAVLSKLMIEGPCGAPPTLHPSDVYFFDDQLHPDLKLRLGLGINYINVPEYKYKTSALQIEPLFVNALRSAGILDSAESVSELLRYSAKKCSGKIPDSFEDYLALHVKHTGKTAPADSTPPDADNGISLVSLVLAKLGISSNTSNNVNMEQTGGKARRRKGAKTRIQKSRKRVNRKTRKYKSKNRR